MLVIGTKPKRRVVRHQRLADDDHTDLSRGPAQGDFRRGRRQVVGDRPRRTETAKHASEHVAVRPGGNTSCCSEALASIFAERDRTDLRMGHKRQLRRIQEGEVREIEMELRK